MGYAPSFETIVTSRLTAIEVRLDRLVEQVAAHMSAYHNPNGNASKWHQRPTVQMAGAGVGGGITVAALQLLLELVKRA